MAYLTELFPQFIDYDAPYLTSHLITCIGNKRSLLPFINQGIEAVKTSLGKDKLIAFDGFSGSGVVARLLKYHASTLWVNDLEEYCAVINKCYLANPSEVDMTYIHRTMDWLNANRFNAQRDRRGFIEQHYAPLDDNDIKEGERVFYTTRNASIIDKLKLLINKEIDEDKRSFFLAPLIVKASIHTNTSGVFKGFHKKDGVGRFGGNGENALERIKKEIVLESPVFSEVECEVHLHKKDVNALVRSSEFPAEFDLVYYDPPYNQHPYGSNYFMLNIIASESEEVEIQDGISGIVRNWNRSAYNKRKEAEDAIDDLIAHTRAKYILFSYNDEGMVRIDRFKDILGKYGSFDLMVKEYNTYKGSRNLRQRNIKVNELLWILKKR